ncbi:hypothetical protein C2G38_2187395 [Gigaspora rosea]|uniref:Uncharacterized protein n=1 Tax=Gigaspora rosea TaxID=44941 RepID=A0A397V650_9GLOM|nr:hypothetical protein C2G38_2187395 [Gigaspora rosea]
MQNIKESYLTLNGHIRPPLFNIVPIKYWVCDSLHIMLKISDQLWKLFLSDLQSGELNENFQILIIAEMKRLNVTFYFWTAKKTQKFSQERAMQLRQLWTGFFEPYNLMNSPNTNGLQFKIKAESCLHIMLKILENFDFTKFISKEFSQERAMQLRQLWTGFFEPYNLMNSPNTNGLQFKIKAESWLNLFLKPSRGQPNRSNFVHGMYRLIDIHHAFGLVAFNCSAMKKNHLQVCCYFQSTLKDGGHEEHRRSCIIEILEHKNHELFYQLFEIPNYFKKSTIYRLEN